MSKDIFLQGNLLSELAAKYANRQPLTNEEFTALCGLLAAEGYVLLADGRIEAAKIAAYDVERLLLPVMPQSCPVWFSWNEEKGYFDYSPRLLASEFIRVHALKRHTGKFFADGKEITEDAIKDELYKSIALVRANPAKYLDGVLRELDHLCRDDEPQLEGQKERAVTARNRLSIEALGEEMKLRGFDIRLNLVSRAFEITGTTETGRTMQLDDLVMLLHNCLADQYKGCSFSTIEQYLVFIGREHAYNPIMDLLAATKHDGKSRIQQLYTLMGIEDDDLSKRLVLKWLLQTVALLFNDEADPFGADGVLVLNGEQGTGKTSLFRHLALKRAWFGEGESINERDKDTSRRAITVWISELGEVESTLKSDVESLKAFISQSVDSYRLPYGRADVVGARHTSLCATCNSERYLLDTTGNRRWWSVPFRRKVPREELLELDALQLWAEVYEFVAPMTYEQKAACFRLSADEQEALTKRNGRFEKPLKGQTEVEDILSKAHEDGLVFREMTVSEFKDHWNVLRGYSAQQIGAALQKVMGEGNRTGKKRVRELPVNMRAEDPFQEKVSSL